jgi:hypothetical protein
VSGEALLGEVYSDVRRAQPRGHYTRRGVPAFRDDGGPWHAPFASPDEYLAADLALWAEPDREPEKLSATKENAVAETTPEGSPTLPFAPIRQVLDHEAGKAPWIVEGYVARGSLTLWSGWPKVGKSTLLFALIAALQEGTPFLGIPTQTSGVLLLTEERTGTLASKVERWSLNGDVHHLRRQQALGEPWAEIVRAAAVYCHQNGLGVLVVDTFAEWARIVSENEAGEVLAAIGVLQEAAGTDLAVQVVSHQRKSPGRFGEAVRGSNALTGAVDIIVEIERAPSFRDPNLRVLQAVSRYEETPKDLVIALTEARYEVLGDSEDAQTGEDRRRVLEAIREAGSATTREIAEVTRLPEATVRRHTTALHADGEIGRTGAGKPRGPYVWHAEIVSATLDSLVAETNLWEDGDA